jgi:hypothetical protein
MEVFVKISALNLKMSYLGIVGHGFNQMLEILCTTITKGDILKTYTCNTLNRSAEELQGSNRLGQHTTVFEPQFGNPLILRIDNRKQNSLQRLLIDYLNLDTYSVASLRF